MSLLLVPSLLLILFKLIRLLLLGGDVAVGFSIIEKERLLLIEYKLSVKLPSDRSGDKLSDIGVGVVLWVELFINSDSFDDAVPKTPKKLFAVVDSTVVNPKRPPRRIFLR